MFAQSLELDQLRRRGLTFCVELGLTLRGEFADELVFLGRAVLEKLIYFLGMALRHFNKWTVAATP